MNQETLPEKREDLVKIYVKIDPDGEPYVKISSLIDFVQSLVQPQDAVEEPLARFPLIGQLRVSDNPIRYEWPALMLTKTQPRFWANYYNCEKRERDMMQVVNAFGAKIERYSSDTFTVDGRRVKIVLPWRTWENGIGCLEKMIETYDYSRSLFVNVLTELKLVRRLDDSKITGDLWKLVARELESGNAPRNR